MHRPIHWRPAAARRPGRASRPAPGRVLLLALAAALPGCGSSAPRDEPAAALSAATAGWTTRDGWTAGVVVALGEKLGGCAVGDVDPEHPGDEIVVCGVSGRLWLVAARDGRWESRLLARAGGEMIQVATGDVDPSSPGDEVVAVGMVAGTEDDGGEGAAHLLRRRGEGWVLEELCRSPALLHAVTTLDVDGRRGDEILVAGFARTVTLLSRADDGWAATGIAEVDGAVKCLLPWQGGVAVACADGALVHLRREGDGTWGARLVEQALAGLARLGTDGTQLAVARDDGTLQLLDGDPGQAADRPAGLLAIGEVHRESGKLRGAVVAELDPATPGPELATAGYGRAVTALTRTDAGWQARVVWEDADRLHHLAAGRLDVLGGTTALVSCGYSGHVVVAIRQP